MILEDVPVDEDHGYDYDLVIRERLRKANEEFEHDQTPAELKRPQRVSFDTVVKAVDIVPQSRDNETTDASPVGGRSTLMTINESSPQVANIVNVTGRHEYTVPLNDIKPRQGPTLTEQLKALQFYGIPLPDKSWTTLESHGNEAQPASIHSSEHSMADSDEDKRSVITNTPLSQPSMVVSKNGHFDLQSRDDYTAQHSSPLSNHERSIPASKAKASFVPKPPSEPKRDQGAPSRRRVQIRPNSSDSVRRTHSSQTRSVSFVKDPTETKDQRRPKRYT